MHRNISSTLYAHTGIHQGLILWPNCVPEKVGVNENIPESKNKNKSLIEINNPNSIKSKMRGRKLRTGVHWHRAMKIKNSTTNRGKTRPWYLA
jgi:hypothetical protein